MGRKQTPENIDLREAMLIELLRAEPLTGAQIEHAIGPPDAVSRHLNFLRKSRLIRQGSELRGDPEASWRLLPAGRAAAVEARDRDLV